MAAVLPPRPRVLRAAFALAAWGVAMAGAADQPGRVVGTVKIVGRPPAIPARRIDKDTALCRHASLPENALVCDASGGVRDAVITLAGGPPAAPGSEPLTLHQKGCDYEPHILVLTAGGRLKIVNDDDLLHNVHAYDEQGVTLFNYAQPFQGISNTATLRNPGLVRLVCDTGHGWMRGYVVVTESRHRAVTGADGGFSLEDVPPGDYVATLFHEYLGKKEQKIHVASGAATPVRFELPVPPSPSVH